MTTIPSPAIAMPNPPTRKLTQRVHRQIISRFTNCLLAKYGKRVYPIVGGIRSKLSANENLSFEGHCAMILDLEAHLRHSLWFHPMLQWEKYIFSLLDFCKKQNFNTENGNTPAL